MPLEHYLELDVDIEIARQDCARYAMALMAGSVAETMVTAKFDRDGADDDFNKMAAATRVFFHLSGDERDQWKAAAAHFKGPSVVEYFDDPLVWSWIERVAETAYSETAYSEGVVTGAEIDALRPEGLTYLLT